MYQLQVAVSKRNKYAVRESGDTVEVVERPLGGLSILIADGQGSGLHAKMLSNFIAARAVALLKEGARDSAVHEVVHDHLLAYRGGRVSCALTTVSADLQTRACTVTRSSNTAAYFVEDGRVAPVDGRAAPLGIPEHRGPSSELRPLVPGLFAVAVTDGISGAGSRGGASLDVPAVLALALRSGASPADVAAALLHEAAVSDRGRPVDDMSVAVLGVVEVEAEDGSPSSEERVMSVVVPLRLDQLLERKGRDGGPG